MLRVHAYSSCFFSAGADEVGPPKKGYKITNQPLKDLGMKFTPLREYLYEAVKSLQEKGFIQKTTDTKVQNINNTVCIRLPDAAFH